MDRKLKHLDFAQGVINRLSTNSFLLKGWSVILVSALFALSANNTNISFVLLAYIPAVAFWALDGYFLSLERRYRSLYEKIRIQEPDEIDFSMNPPKSGKNYDTWLFSVVSKTLLIFHGSIVFSIIIVMSIFIYHG